MSNEFGDEVMSERAELGVDGNAGFALLGENIQEGEAEFVTIECNEPRWTSAWHVAACHAASEAYHKLKGRLPDRQFSYFLGASHPNHC
jgi:hypothetical protein